jgi:hypothetical protein
VPPPPAVGFSPFNEQASCEGPTLGSTAEQPSAGKVQSTTQNPLGRSPVIAAPQKLPTAPT